MHLTVPYHFPAPSGALDVGPAITVNHRISQALIGSRCPERLCRYADKDWLTSFVGRPTTALSVDRQIALASFSASNAEFAAFQRPGGVHKSTCETRPVDVRAEPIGRASCSRSRRSSKPEGKDNRSGAACKSCGTGHGV